MTERENESLRLDDPIEEYHSILIVKPNCTHGSYISKLNDPIYLEVYDGQYGNDDGECISLTVEQAEELALFLLDKVNLIKESKNV